MARKTITTNTADSRETITKDEGYLNDTIITYDDDNFTYDDERLTYDGRILRLRSSIENTGTLTRKTIADNPSTSRSEITNTSALTRKTITNS